ncbi:MAG: glycosyltransferase [Verrucomicrobiota bacterium]
MKACTIAARNYLAQVNLLAASFKKHHPDGEFTVLVIDGTAENTGDKISGLYQLIGLHEIGLSPAEIGRMAMIYDVTEFSTAVKPWLMRYMLGTGAPAVIYLDPDIEIFSPLDDLFELARRHTIVLTPHSTTPILRDGLRLNESDILGSGVYNLGFLGLGQGCGEFLDWWSERLSRESMNDPTRMRFADQRWIDFVPSLYPHHILKDVACNVAYWNLHSRKVVWTGERYEVNGRPLVFFHYSGFDPDQPHLLSKHAGNRPRVLLSQEPGVARLCKEYAARLEKEEFSLRKKSGYGYDRLDNGIQITGPMRKLYRESLLAAEAQPGKELPPAPFMPGGTEAFIAWLNEPATRGNPRFTRYLQSIHASRPDVQLAFPEPAGRDAGEFINWVFTSGRKDYQIPNELMPRNTAPGTGVATRTGGEALLQVPEVDIAGYLQAELGVGEAARLLISGLEAANISFNSISIRGTVNRQNHPFRHTGEEDSGAKVKILCVNSDTTPAFALDMGPSFFQGRHIIGVWFWEIEEFPSSIIAAFEVVNEIWVASEFMAGALRKVSPKPVFAFRLPVPLLKDQGSISKTELGLPERFMFFFSFDFLSIFERKNPIALVHAFKKAFPLEEGPILVIKSINGDRKLPELEKLRHAAAGREDIVIIDGYLSHEQKDAMMARCDCYVSLHRAEGFGLTIAEAMSLAKPVIATRYGGNMDFMSEKNSYLCSYQRTKIGKGSEPYAPDAEWANPDIDEAAALMRHVYAHPGEAEERGKLARLDIASKQSAAACGRFVRERLKQIHATPFDACDNKSSISSPEKSHDELESISQQRVFDPMQTNLKKLEAVEDELITITSDLMQSTSACEKETGPNHPGPVITGSK